MPFDIDNLNPIYRFYYPDKDGEEWIEFRALSADEMKRLRKEIGVKKTADFYEEKKYNRIRRVHKVEGEEIKDEDKWFEAVWDYQIVNWFIVTPSGEEVPCTTENKLKLLLGSPQFLDFAVAKIEDVTTNNAKVEEERSKN